MKICYVLSEFPNLSQTFVRDEIRALERKGHQVLVVAYAPQKGVPLDMVKGWTQAPIVYFSEYVSRRAWAVAFLQRVVRSPRSLVAGTLFFLRWSARRPAFTWRRLVWLADCLHSADMGHLHAHFGDGATEFAMLLSKMSGLPYSFTTHAADIFVAPDAIPEKLKHSKFMATISAYNKHYIERSFLAKDPDLARKIHVIHCGISERTLNESLPSLPSTGLFKIVTVGRLVEKKGMSYLIEACAILRNRGHSDFQCVLVGDGPLYDELRHQVVEAGLEGIVHLYGGMSHADALSEVDGAGAFVLPCIVSENGNRDGIPVVLMEALALGIPVLSTRVSGIPELLEGVGVLVDSGDAEAIADRLEDLMKLSEEERRVNAERGQKRIRDEFLLEQEVDKLLHYVAATHY